MITLKQIGKIRMLSSIRLNHVNVNQVIIITVIVILLCNAWSILVKLVPYYKHKHTVKSNNKNINITVKIH